MPNRTLRRAAPIVAAALVAILVAAGAANAHANLRSATPPPNSRLPADGLPDEVFLTFTEPLDSSYSVLHLLNDEQEAVEAAPSEIVGTEAMRLPLPDALPDGVYVLSWRALSTVDGHVTAGAFVYIIGNASVPKDFDSIIAAAASEPPAQSGGPVETAARAFAMIGLFLLGGVSVFVVALAGPVAHAPAAYRRTAARAAAAGGAVAAVAAIAASVGYAGRAVGADALDAAAWWAAVTGTRIGWTWLARALLAAVGAAILLALHRRAPSAAFGTAAAAGALALVAQAFASHSGALPNPGLGVALDFVHLAAGAVWLGGLPALGFALTGTVVARKMALAVAFSALATWSVAAVVLSGVVMSFAHLGSLSNLWSTAWGVWLVMKLAIVGVLLGMGAYNKFVLVPRIERGDAPSLRAMWRAVSAESGIALALVVSVALLTANSPPSSEADAPVPQASTGILVLEEQGRYGSNFTLRIGPAEPLTPGLHLYELRVVDDGRNVTNGNATLHFTYLEQDIGTSEMPLNLTDEGVYRDLGGNLALPGLWRVEAVMSGRSDALDERVAWDVQVEG